MRRLLFTALMLLVVASAASAGTLTVNGEVSPPPITITKEADVTVSVGRTPGTTSYNDGSAAFSVTSYAKFKVSSDSNTSLTLTIPASSTLTKQSGTETATLNFACRNDASAYPADKNGGATCGATATTSGTGELYLAMFPTSITFDSDTAGTYAGTVTISINY